MTFRAIDVCSGAGPWNVDIRCHWWFVPYDLDAVILMGRANFEVKTEEKAFVNDWTLSVRDLSIDRGWQAMKSQSQNNTKAPLGTLIVSNLVESILNRQPHHTITVRDALCLIRSAPLNPPQVEWRCIPFKSQVRVNLGENPCFQ